MNYEELEGKEIQIYCNGEKVGVGIVVGCDPDIGITICDKFDVNKYLFCQIGPSAPNWMYPGDKVAEMHCRSNFNHRIEQLKRGMLILGVGYVSLGEPSAETCPFAQ